jgi:CDP-diacylglycerol--inositol 3-phosphatidyltransferase
MPSTRARSSSRIAAKSPANKVDTKKSKGVDNCSVNEVLLYYPNLIGYLRVIFMLLSLYYGRRDWTICVACYCIAFGGDVVDGFVARAFDQCSSYGGILDMVTDRISTAGFLCMLSSLQPQYSFYFSLLAVLDIASHWFHIASVSGAGHKNEETLRNRNPILKWYYSIYILFGYCCVSAEFFYIFLYIHHYTNNDLIYQIAIYGCMPGCILKNFINIVQMCSACYALAEHDAEMKNKK